MVIDSPPVLAVADAAVLANGASGVVFVVGADQTSRQTATRGDSTSCTRCTRAVIGAVLNRADVERNPYYYAHYYRKEYASTTPRRPGEPNIRLCGADLQVRLAGQTLRPTCAIERQPAPMRQLPRAI